MDTIPTMPTPLMEAAIGETPRLKKFLEAKETLLTGLAEGKVWNVDVQEAKHDLGYCYEDALTPSVTKWNDLFRSRLDSSIISEMWEEVSYYLTSNQAKGRADRLEKFLARANQPQWKYIYELTPKMVEATLQVVEVYREIQLFDELLKSIKPLIVKGRRPAENPTEVDLTNTGICPICRRRQKLNDDRLVHHGFRISDGGRYIGYRVGTCFGVRFLAYELSNEGNVAYLPVLAGWLETAKSSLKDLKAGKITSFSRMEMRYSKHGQRCHPYEEKVTYSKGETMYATLLDSAIYSAERDIRHLNDDIVLHTALVENWTLQPLKYGRKVV